MNKCFKCGVINPEGALFCEKCGNRLSSVTKKRKFRLRYIVITVICIAVLGLSGIWAASEFSPYNRNVKLGYSLMSENRYEEAILAFDNAIQIDDKKSEAYFGKAESIANNENMTYEIAEEIVNTLIEGYEKTNDARLILYLKDASGIVKENGFEAEAEQILNGYFMNLPENTEDVKVNKEDVIYSEFVKAYDFWLTWIYYQTYAEYDFSIEPPLGKNYVRAVAVHEEIDSKKELEDTIKNHFAGNLAERYISALEPQDKDGKLYINALYGGVGDYGMAIKEYDFEEISKDKYVLRLTLYDTIGVDYGEELDEEDMFHSNVLCTMNNGNWVFGNYFENFETQLVGTWNCEYGQYGREEKMEFTKDGSVIRKITEPGIGEWSEPDGAVRNGSYVFVDSNAIEVKFDDSNKAELYVFNTNDSFITREQVRDETGAWEDTKYWTKENDIQDDLFAIFDESPFLIN